jgi:hypothetical protein
MRIGRPRIEERDGRVEYRTAVESGSGPPELWFAVAREHGDLLSNLADAALLTLILPAMRAGEHVRVEGPLSEKLLYNLGGIFQSVVARVIPSLSRARIDAREAVSPVERARGVGTGFSAGIDSFSVLADHHYGNPSPGFRLTHLIYNNVGSHGEAGGTALFRLRYDRLMPVAERIGLPFVAVDSNLPAFFDGLDFKETYSLRNTVVGLLLQKGLGRSFLAAGTTVMGPPPTLPVHDISHLDPSLLPMMSTEVFDAVWVGGDQTRVAKTLRVAEIEDSWDALDVCVRNDRAGNCSTCKKCVRTLLTLEIVGLQERYASVFDFPLYRRERHWRVARILRKNLALSLEIKALARERGYSFPLRERLIARTRLDEIRDWSIRKAATSARGKRWLDDRKRRRSPLFRTGP